MPAAEHMMETPPPGCADLTARIRALCHALSPIPTAVDAQLRHIAGVRAVLFDVYGTLLCAGQGEVGAADPANGKAAGRDGGSPACMKADAAPAAQLSAAFAAAGLVLAPADAAAVAARLQAEIAQDHRVARQNGIEHPEVEIRAIWRRVLAHVGGDPRRAARLAVEYECRVNPTWPMPGMRTTLDRIEQAGLTLGIVSNAQFYTPLLLTVFAESGWGRGRFDRRLCTWSYREGIAKPAPALLARSLAALHRLHGIGAAQTIYIGNDMLNDIMPAAQLGCRTALFAGDARSLRLRTGEPRLADIQPDLVLTSLPQLADCLADRM
jgi:putative hydrolase of the HAD superfamily